MGVELLKEPGLDDLGSSHLDPAGKKETASENVTEKNMRVWLYRECFTKNPKTKRVFKWYKELY